MRTILLLAMVVLLVAAPTARVQPTARVLQQPCATVRRTEGFSFVSMPDFLNADLADASGSPYWHPGDPNSINDSYTTAITLLLDDVRAEGARDVLSPGDLADGHWGMDSAHTGIFGPLRTHDQKVASVKLAARTYFGAVKKEFTDRGMCLFPAVGDHDVGDNPWKVSRGGWYRFKHDNLQVWRNAWAREFTDGGTRFARRPRGTEHENSAYATYLTPGVLLVSVDGFVRTRSDVVPTVGHRQLGWLERQLKDARAHHVPWVVVQAHAPVLTPVRHRHSSNIHLAGGARSPFWRLLRKYDVDLYLCGEVHATTAITPQGGPVQISNGGLINRGQSTYLTGRISHGVMRIVVKGWRATVTLTPPTWLWESDMTRVIHRTVTYRPGTHVLGTMRLTSAGAVLGRSGVLEPYTPR